MKSLKFDHEYAECIAAGTLQVTWRLQDDKDLAVGDQVQLIDKVAPDRPQSWKPFATARIDRILERQYGKISQVESGTQLSADGLDIPDLLLNFYNNDVTPTTIIYLIYFVVLSEEEQTDVAKATKDVTKLHLYTDGGSRGNPGPSAAGYVIMRPSDNTVLVDKSVYLGVTSNNLAEYMGLRYGLETAARMGAREVDCYLDSMLVVNQMKAIFKNRDRELWPIHDAIQALAATFTKVTFLHIPREENRHADAAVNRALDAAIGANDTQSLS